MKTKIFTLLIVIMFASEAHAFLRKKCYKLPCYSNINAGQSSSEEEISRAYEELYSKMDKMKEKYKEQLEKLKEQNKLLENYKKILSHSSFQDKKIVFLLQKFNKLQGNKNSLEGLK